MLGNPFTLIFPLFVNRPVIPFTLKAFSETFQFAPPFDDDAKPTKISLKGEVSVNPAQQT
jgi:hypothetical protein